MARRMRTLHATLATTGLLVAFAMSGCGDDDGGGSGDGDGTAEAGNGGDGGTDEPGGGGTTAGRGGSSPGQSGAGGAPADPVAGEGGGAGVGGEGGGGAQPAGIEDVVAAVCQWEFGCCDAGEIGYRLSPFIDSVERCTSRLVYEMRESNVTSNPYVSGPVAPGGLLGVLAYVVDLSRVEVNQEGVAECISAWEERDCAQAPDPSARCEGAPEPDPCALSNLFMPKLRLGDECTLSLGESAASNDIECPRGSSCLAADDPDNPKTVPSCIKRGVEGEPCIEDNDCDFDFYCNDGDCAEKPGVGERCAYDNLMNPAPGAESVPCKAGLSCHPLALECVAPCTIGFTCTIGATDADAACPEGAGCVPLEVGGSSEAFRVCAELGESTEALCNSDGDCVESHYCDLTRCRPDKQESQPCALQNECAAGLHCDIGGTGLCTANFAANAACIASEQCGPDSAGCLNTGATRECRDALLRLGDRCGSPLACASGRCELASATATESTCIRGGSAEDPCDSDLTNGTAQSCARGLICFGETGTAGSGTCVEQALPGEACTDPAGEPNPALCANAGQCTDVWDGPQRCTDAAVPETNGGSGLVCDGA